MHFTVVPVALGRLITYKHNDVLKENALSTYLVGWFSSLGIFYVLCSLIEWHQYWNTFDKPFTGTFTALCVSYSVIIAILLLVWIKKDLSSIKRLFFIVTGFPKRIKDVRLSDIKGNLPSVFYAVVFIVILAVQLYFSYGYQIGEWSYDDYDYVVNSQDTIATDTIAYANYITGEMPFTADKRAVTAWPTYIAYLARVSDFEVATVCHTILPVILLLVAYIAFYYMATFLFKDNENRIIFMCILSFLYMFGLYSHNSPTFRLLGAIWQGKAVLSVIAIPFIMIFLFKSYMDELTNSRLIPLALTSLGISSLSSMSMVLMPCLCFGIWFVMCIYHKRIYGLRYLIASLFGCIYLYGFYVLMRMLLSDMTANSHTKYFTRGKEINWWYRWFGKIS